MGRSAVTRAENIKAELFSVSEEYRLLPGGPDTAEKRRELGRRKTWLEPRLEAVLMAGWAKIRL